MTLEQEIARRRTFAIISHPDAGKTTLTEKLLLFGGAIHVAGAVKSNKIKKTATSDWMEIEKQRGISVATSVMGFEYNNFKINILDTPGHQDFAEDTFRTLTAVDSVIIVIDAAKGVEMQTRKLMQVCRMRRTPVMIFINKMDREGKNPFDLLDELEVWGNKLLELEAGELHAVPQDDIVMHFEEGFPVTFRRVGDKLMVNVTQITMRFGKIPSEWLRIASTDMLRREMAGNGHTGKYESQVFTTRGRGHGATWLESPLVIPLARWIAPDLSLAEWLGEAIGKLSVKRGKTIVRERPRVAAPGLPCMDCPMPQDMESATRLILELRKVVSESLPKIVFYEEFIENRDWFKSTRIADELGISPRQLHQFLAEEGICKYEKRQWVVFPSCRAWQCDVPYTWENSRGKVYTFGSTKRWTQAGRECIIELWRKRNPEYCPPGA